MSFIEPLADLFNYGGAGELSGDPYLPIVDHVRRDIAICADGSHLVVLAMPGAPVGLLSTDGRNGLFSRWVAFLNGIADENVELHVHLAKHDARLPPLTYADAREEYAARFLADYHGSIAPDRGILEWSISLRFKPRRPPFAGLLDQAKGLASRVKLLPRRNPVQLDPLLEAQASDAIRLALATLAPFRPRVLATEEREAVTFSQIAEHLKVLRDMRFEPQPLCDPLGFLGAGIATTDVTAVRGKRMLRLDHAAGGSAASQTWCCILGLTAYPAVLDQSRMDDLLALRGRFVLTVAIRFETRAEAQDALALMRRQLIQSGGVSGIQDIADLETAIMRVAGGRAETGISRWSLALHGDTPAEVDRLVSDARNVIANAGAKVRPESRGMYSSFLGQFPAAPASTWIRPARCNTRQIAMLATLAGYPRGVERGRWGPPLLHMLTPGDTDYAFDLFVGDVGHNPVIGPNGGGKTVYIGACICAVDALVSAKGGTQIVLDVDESNACTILALRGRYSTIKPGSSGLAVLRGLPNTPRVRVFLRELVAGLAQTDGAPPPTPAERRAILEGVRFVMGEMAPEDRSLAVIRDMIAGAVGWDGTAAERLDPWCRGNELAWVFDGDEFSVDFNARLVGVDITGVMQDARVMPPVAMALLWLASEVMDGRRVVLWCEEAPAYMPSPAFAPAFKGLALRARKRNASFNAIAQQPGDLLENPAGGALIRQARQIVAFRNEKPVEADYRTGMGFTAAELRAVREDMFKHPWHSVLVKRQDGESAVLKFDLSGLPEHLHVLSGTPPRVRLLRECLAKEGGDVPRALALYERRMEETAA